MDGGRSLFKVIHDSFDPFVFESNFSLPAIASLPINKSCPNAEQLVFGLINHMQPCGSCVL